MLNLATGIQEFIIPTHYGVAPLSFSIRAHDDDVMKVFISFGATNQGAEY